MKATVSAEIGAEIRSSDRLPKRALANPAKGEDAIAPTVMQASINPSLPGEKWTSLLTAGIRAAQLTKKPVLVKMIVSETRAWRLVTTNRRLPVRLARSGG